MLSEGRRGRLKDTSKTDRASPRRHGDDPSRAGQSAVSRDDAPLILTLHHHTLNTLESWSVWVWRAVSWNQGFFRRLPLLIWTGLNCFDCRMKWSVTRGPGDIGHWSPVSPGTGTIQGSRGEGHFPLIPRDPHRIFPPIKFTLSRHLTDHYHNGGEKNKITTCLGSPSFQFILMNNAFEHNCFNKKSTIIKIYLHSISSSTRLLLLI